MNPRAFQWAPVLRAFACGVGLTTSWLVAGLFIVPSVITSAYHERSLPFLNEIIAGRDVNPVETYLQVWHRITLDVLWICVAVSIAAIAAEVWQQRRGQAQPDTPADMPRHRFVIANVAILGVFVGFLLVQLGVRWGVSGDDPWPLSTFPMYSGVVSEPFAYFNVFVTTPGPDSERVFIDGPAFYPFDHSQITANFSTFHRDRPRIERLLAHLRRRYNSRVAAGELATPPAECLELYLVQLPLRSPVHNPLKNIPPVPTATACGPVAGR